MVRPRSTAYASHGTCDRDPKPWSAWSASSSSASSPVKAKDANSWCAVVSGVELGEGTALGWLFCGGKAQQQLGGGSTGAVGRDFSRPRGEGDDGAQGDPIRKAPQGSTLEVSRHGHNETGVLHHQYITQDLRSTASALNQVDEFLYGVVSAKMCSRLGELGLLEHPVVQAELAASPLGKRCASREWYEGMIDSVDGVMDTHRGTEDEVCRLFRPILRPPRPVRSRHFY